MARVTIAIIACLLLAGCSAASAEGGRAVLEADDLPEPAHAVLTCHGNVYVIAVEGEPEAEQAPVYDEQAYEFAEGENGTAEGVRIDAAYYGDGTDAAYGQDGPTREMPGYHDGRKETYYSSNVLHHYRTDEWIADDEGFYRDSEGRYVVGVGLGEYEVGDTFQGGKGECVVADFGYTQGITDYYTNW